MGRILWLSPHAPLPRQMEALKRMFGEVEVDVDRDVGPLRSAEEIVERFRKGGYDEIVIDAPLSVIDRVVDLGVEPLFHWCGCFKRRMKST